MKDHAHFIDNLKAPGSECFSPAEAVGDLLKEQLIKDPHFYLFSPDETTSNKLQAVYDVESRAWALPAEEWDLPESASGRIVELLSENTLLATQLGHIMNCEPAMFASYEAFLPIVTSQIIQHAKFLTQCRGVKFRPNYPALNLLSTSTCWRQDHNGFTHQSPALISTLLSRPDNVTNCLFPVDDIAAATAIKYMLKSENVVNLTTFNKTPEPRWIDSNHAEFQYQNGASIFDFASDPEPDFILTAAGDIPSRETLSAIKILKKDLSGLRLRFVGIAALSYGAIGTVDSKMEQKTFDDYFTKDRPIIANFHGYANTLASILESYAEKSRLSVHGFEDHGSTTTPFEMLSLNHISRYDLAAEIAEKTGHKDLAKKYQNIIKENHAYAAEYGTDLVQIYK